MIPRKRWHGTDGPDTFWIQPARVLVFTAIAFVLAVPICMANTNGGLDANDAQNGRVAVATSNVETAEIHAESGLYPSMSGATVEAANATLDSTIENSTLLVATPPNYLLASDPVARNREHPAKCNLLLTLCSALMYRRVLLLASAQTAALVADGVTTRQFLSRGYVEVDPITKIFIGSKPTWSRMAPLGAVQVFAGMWLAERMATSRHAWIRRFWWVPQVLGIAGNVTATTHNIALP